MLANFNILATLSVLTLLNDGRLVDQTLTAQLSGITIPVYFSEGLQKQVDNAPVELDSDVPTRVRRITDKIAARWEEKNSPNVQYPNCRFRTALPVQGEVSEGDTLDELMEQTFYASLKYDATVGYYLTVTKEGEPV